MESITGNNVIQVKTMNVKKVHEYVRDDKKLRQR